MDNGAGRTRKIKWNVQGHHKIEVSYNSLLACMLAYFHNEVAKNLREGKLRGCGNPWVPHPPLILQLRYEL